MANLTMKVQFLSTGILCLTVLRFHLFSEYAPQIIQLRILYCALYYAPSSLLAIPRLWCVQPSKAQSHLWAPFGSLWSYLNAEITRHLLLNMVYLYPTVCKHILLKYGRVGWGLVEEYRGGCRFTNINQAPIRQPVLQPWQRYRGSVPSEWSILA